MKDLKKKKNPGTPGVFYSGEDLIKEYFLG